MNARCNMTEAEREEAMAQFRPLSTKELEKAKGGFKRYLFYETWGRRNFREYFCPFCGRFEIERPVKSLYIEDPFLFKHNDLANCPLCQQEMTLICLGRMRNMKSIEQTGNLLFLRAAGNTLTISAGLAMRRFDPGDLDPWPEYHEKMRYVIAPGKRQGWKKTTLWEGCYPSGYRWDPTKTVYEPFQRNYFAMTDGTAYVVGAEEIAKTSMKHCQLLDFAWKIGDIDMLEENGNPAPPLRAVVSYLAEYSRRPQIEMLVKLGYEDVVFALLQRGSLPKNVANWEAKTPAAFFGMTKQEFRAFREMDGNFADLEAWRNLGPKIGELSFEEYVGARHFLGVETPQMIKLCCERELNGRQVIRYIQEQAAEGDDGKTTFRCWQDYLGMAERLGRNMTWRRNLFPSNVWTAHDAACVLVRRLDRRAENEKYGVRFRWLKKKYAYSDGELIVVVPVSAEDIKREGKVLSHCVGGYADRHIRGATTILFLRKAEKPEERYVTIEIDDAYCMIRQVHGYGNERDGAEPPSKRHKAFFDEWLLWLKQGSPRLRNGKPVRPKQKEEKLA